MSGRIRYTEEFKRDAVCQVTDRGYSVAERTLLSPTVRQMYDPSFLPTERKFIFLKNI